LQWGRCRAWAQRLEVTAHSQAFFVKGVFVKASLLETAVAQETQSAFQHLRQSAATYSDAMLAVPGSTKAFVGQDRSHGCPATVLAYRRPSEHGGRCNRNIGVPVQQPPPLRTVPELTIFDYRSRKVTPFRNAGQLRQSAVKQDNQSGRAILLAGQVELTSDLGEFADTGGDLGIVSGAECGLIPTHQPQRRDCEIQGQRESPPHVVSQTRNLKMRRRLFSDVTYPETPERDELERRRSIGPLECNKIGDYHIDDIPAGEAARYVPE
jgi:hypothetical protein